jgi:ribosome-associated protein
LRRLVYSSSNFRAALVSPLLAIRAKTKHGRGVSEDLFIADGLFIPAAELRWVAVRSSGPGGQNVNKVSTKVELRFDLEGSTVLPEPVRTRLRALARTRCDAEGWILITSQRSRSQETNLQDARQKLAAFIRRALTPPIERRPTTPTRGAKERRLRAKKELADKKAGRRKVVPSE